MTAMWRRLAAILAAGMFVVFLTAGGAAANTTVDDPCVSDPSPTCVVPTHTKSELLPVNRWSDATGSLHGRLSSNPIYDITEKIQRNGTFPTLMTLGNSMWSGATGMTTAAVRLDLLNTAGQTIDNQTAKIGDSLMSSGVVALLAMIALVVPMWRAARGQGQAPWTAFGKTAGTVALFSLMVVGAGQSTTVNGQFEPGRFSPGWFVVTTNTVLSTLASAPAASLSMTDSGAGYTYDDSAKGPLSCYEYVNLLKSDYATANRVDQVEGSMPLVMSSMWEATGLQVWSMSQFGAVNPYGDFAYCRLLDQHAGTSSAVQFAFTSRATTDPVKDSSNLYSFAWRTAENEQEDRTMVAWGQCRPDGTGGWKLADGWSTVKGRDPADTIRDCKDWWEKPSVFATDPNGDTMSNTFDDGSSNFEWSKQSDIMSDVPNVGAENYLLTLQGHDGGGSSSLALIWSYLFSSLIVLVIFGLISGGIIIAKVSALAMMLSVFFALLLSLWPSANGGSKIGKFFGQYVGMALLVFGLQLIFAFLTLITSLMIQAGNEMFGGGTMIAMIWTGFAPVTAIAVLHMIFTKFLKLPSPFTMQGAQQWGAAAGGGAVGGAVGAGVMNRVNRMKARSEYAMMRQGERAGGRALGVVSGGKFGRGGRPGRAGALTGGGSGAGGGDTNAQGGQGPKGRKTWGPASAAAAQSGAPKTEGTSSEGTPQGGRGRSKTVGDGKFVGGERTYGTRAERKDARTSDNAAATERGWKGGVVGRYREGLANRWAAVGDELKNRPVRKSVATAAKVAGSAALIVGTGGLAAPVMAGVWGKNHVGRVRDARRASVMEYDSQRAADQYAAAKEAAATKVEATQPAGALPEPRFNREPVVVAPAATRVPNGPRVAGTRPPGTRTGGTPGGAARTQLPPVVVPVPFEGRRAAGGQGAKPFRR